MSLPGRKLDVDRAEWITQTRVGDAGTDASGRGET